MRESSVLRIKADELLKDHKPPATDAKATYVTSAARSRRYASDAIHALTTSRNGTSFM